MKEINVTSLNELDGVTLTDFYRIEDSLHIRTNMVLSSDGYFVDADGASRHFSSPEDMRIFNLLRSLSDVVLVGANTAVLDNYGQIKIRSEFLDNRASPDDVPVIALVSKSLRIPYDARIFTMPGPKPIIFTVHNTQPDWVIRFQSLSRIADVVLLKSDTDNSMTILLEQITSELRHRGLTRVLCEGGPQLLEWMFRADLVTHIAATWSNQKSRFQTPQRDPLPTEFTATSRISADGQIFEQLVRSTL